MPHGYTCLVSQSPRSFLFSVVANVGPRGASRSLAVAYRQGRDTIPSPLSRVDHVVQDTLALIEILSDPANRAALEAESALAAAWYQGNQADPMASDERPSVPDTPQPAFVIPDGRQRELQPQPELPWQDSLREFPFTTTCLLLGLLRADATNSTRPADVQLQPLSTVFRGDCTEYGLVVLDISDLQRVKYGIVAFPVRYMADVYHRGENFGWDPVEDPPPEKEPDVVPITPRPRVPLSILGYLRKYFNYVGLEEDLNVLRLEDRPLVGPGSLDYIWPPELENQARASSQRNLDMDRAVDNLLLLTQADLDLDETTIAKFQKLAEFREQLRRRLEEVPDSLGPSEASGHILRVAYAGRTHLNWVAFRNLRPGVIAAAMPSDELRGASALSLCVDNLEGADLGDLGAVMAQSTSLKQLCFLQRPDRNSDDSSVRFCAQLLASSGDSLLHNRTIYPTFAFSASLCKLTRPSTSVIPAVQDFPVMHMFVRQRKDVVADHPQYQNSYYDMGNTLLDADRFAVRFISYLRSVGSDKSILRFARGTSSLTADNPPSGQFAVTPIPAGFFGNLADEGSSPSSQSIVRDMQPGTWAILVSVEGALLRYSFVRRTSAEVAPHQEGHGPEHIEVVGGLKEFLREAVPGIDISTTCERRLEEVEKDLRARASIETGENCIGIMTETCVKAMLNSFLGAD